VYLRWSDRALRLRTSARAEARGSHARGYVLLETVVATGMLIVGLAVIGAQVQDAQESLRTMDRRTQAMMLAERQLAELDMGLVELDSVDDVVEHDFGPRYPDWGWTLTTSETALANMFLERLDILYRSRDGEYKEDDFDHERAEIAYTLYTMRALQPPVNFAVDFGLDEEEARDLGDKFSNVGIPGLDVNAFDPRLLQNIDLEELMKALPVIMDALRMDISQLVGSLPPDLLQQLIDSGILGEDGQLNMGKDQGTDQGPRQGQGQAMGQGQGQGRGGGAAP